MRRFCQALALGVAVLCAVSTAHARGLADMSGAEIKALQQRLADGHCYQGAIDGQTSPTLQAAINACPSRTLSCASRPGCMSLPSNALP